MSSGAGARSEPGIKRRRTDDEDDAKEDDDPRPPFPTSIRVRWDRLADVTCSPMCYDKGCRVCTNPPKSKECFVKGDIKFIQIGSVRGLQIHILTIEDPLHDQWLRQANVPIAAIRAFAGTAGASSTEEMCEEFAMFPTIFHSTLYGFGRFGMALPIDGDDLPYRSRPQPPPTPDVKLFEKWLERLEEKNPWEAEQYGSVRELSLAQLRGDDGLRCVRFNGPWPNGLAWKTINQPSGWTFTNLNACHIV